MLIGKRKFIEIIPHKTLSMQARRILKDTFIHLHECINALSDHQYRNPCSRLGGASVGQHIRHIIELFVCLQEGYYSGVINYDKRKRDRIIETDRQYAASLLIEIYESIEKPHKKLVVEFMYPALDGTTFQVATNYYREVMFNFDHSIHHMAMIRIGVEEMQGLDLPEEFGVATSTSNHRRARA
jgi:hypothetical protein